MYKKVIKNKQSCHFASQGGDHYNIRREEKCFMQGSKDFHLFLNSGGRVWQDETRTLVNWSDLSPLSAGVLNSVPEASGYFAREVSVGVLIISCSPCWWGRDPTP